MIKIVSKWLALPCFLMLCAYSGVLSASSTPEPTTPVKSIFSTNTAFAALKTDGSVVTWGDHRYGGDSSAVEAQLSSDVQTIFSTKRAFAALKIDGSVVTWGRADGGGDSTAVAAQLSSEVKTVFRQAMPSPL